MPIRGPLATLLAVAAAGAAVVATNVALTAGPSDVEQPTAALSANEAYGSSGAGGGGSASTAPAAPAPAATAAPVRYDGRTAGDEVTVQVTVENGQAKAYLCNADKGIESWVRGPATNGTMTLTGDDGASVEARSDGTAVFGTARADGKSWPFAAAAGKDAPVTSPAAPAAPDAQQGPAQPEPARQAPVEPQQQAPSYSGGGY